MRPMTRVMLAGAAAITTAVSSNCGAAGSPADSNPASSDAGTRTIQGDELTLTVPEAWDGRVVKDGGIVVLQAGSGPLPAFAHDDSGHDVIDGLDSGGVFINIMDYGAPASNLHWRNPASTPHIGPADLSPGEPAIAPKVRAYEPVVMDDNALVVGVGFGEDNPSSADISEVNRILATLSVATNNSAADATTQHCPLPADFGPHLDVTLGPVGSTVTISGAYDTIGEGGSYAPLGSIKVWWNLNTDYPSPDVTAPAPADAGSPLAAVGGDDVSSNSTCTHRVQFHVPQASPGTYPVVALEVAPDGSTASAGYVRFRVTH